jgi:hypothetical protein
MWIDLLSLVGLVVVWWLVSAKLLPRLGVPT